MKKLKILGLSGLLTLSTLLPTKTEASEVRFSPALGFQVPTSKAILEDYSSGFTAGADVKFGNPVSFDLGVFFSLYSGRDDYSITENGIFSRSTESYSKTLEALSFRAGPTLSTQNENGLDLFFNGGIHYSIFNENESFRYNSRREQYNDSSSKFEGNGSGFHIGIGINNIPLGNHPCFIKFEFNNTTIKEKDYSGFSILLGKDFN